MHTARYIVLATHVNLVYGIAMSQPPFGSDQRLTAIYQSMYYLMLCLKVLVAEVPRVRCTTQNERQNLRWDKYLKKLWCCLGVVITIILHHYVNLDRKDENCFRAKLRITIRSVPYRTLNPLTTRILPYKYLKSSKSSSTFALSSNPLLKLFSSLCVILFSVLL